MGRVVSTVKVLVGWVVMSVGVWVEFDELGDSLRAGSLSPQSQVLQNSIAKGPGLIKGGLAALGDGGAVGIWMRVILGFAYCCLVVVWGILGF